MKEELLKNKQYFDKYYFIAPGSDYGNIMWKDIAYLDKAEIFENNLKKCGTLLKYIHHIHFSFQLNRYFEIPFKSIWKNQYSINPRRLSNEEEKCIIYTDISACRTDQKFIKTLSKKKKATLVLILVNTVKSKKNMLKNRIRYFDQIYTFDYSDSLKYNFYYYPTNYSKILLEENDIESDAFFVGVSKNREELLHEIYNRLIQHNCKADFNIMAVKKTARKYPDINYHKWINYNEVLEKISKTNCIIEVVEECQTGMTLRTMEAICYDKKLITNNKSVKESLFYQTGNILVFESVDDIDIKFLKNTNQVKYNYNDEFSPIHFIDYINEIKIMDNN